jgi:hypothetical protein
MIFNPEQPMHHNLAQELADLELPEVNRIAARSGPRQEQDRFLNIGRQAAQIHNFGAA